LYVFFGGIFLVSRKKYRIPLSIYISKTYI